ncbi:SMI1/KNR4 family protein [Cellulophaga sp. E16_2]|uniref:SMI1/KNR4 family protein n=1 Tax=Cellulophaga sp. E16_2 TaxID=2789297 RepID=UPI001A9399BF|nr:SMI1/KNR4 family protein [Cellulophaga sp. E16_2]MBO0592215.1 SMI1/KNR4 family protein [Cellulophaga sp. E16_2]
MYLNEAKEFMAKYPQITSEFRGCSEEEIKTLESLHDPNIPEAFKEFLKWFGKSGGKILSGTDYYYPYLSGEIYQDWIEDEIVPIGYKFNDVGLNILNRNGFDGQELMKDSMVIMSHQGYAVEFIKTNEGNNPPVYIFVEQGDWLKKGPTIWGNTFSAYLLNMLEQEIKALEKIGLLK